MFKIYLVMVKIKAHKKHNVTCKIRHSAEVLSTKIKKKINKMLILKRKERLQAGT